MAKKPLPLSAIVVDIGNSDYKYALVTPDGTVLPFRAKSEPKLARYKVPIIGLCVSPKRGGKFEQNNPVKWIKNRDIPIVAPDAIGADRLVALYSARCLYQANAIAVIDVGTFLTLSVFQDDTFQGGYIVPGPHTMIASYRAGALLPDLSRWTLNMASFPINTREAIQAGTTLTLQRAVESLIGDILKERPDTLIVGTGGAVSLLRSIDSVHVINPTLVLEGIAALAKVKGFF